VFSSFAEVVY